jgi:hypothetical protein
MEFLDDSDANVTYSVMDVAARSQAFMGAFFSLCNDIRRVFQVHAHDAQLLEAQKAPIRRLLASIERVSCIDDTSTALTYISSVWTRHRGRSV